MQCGHHLRVLEIYTEPRGRYSQEYVKYDGYRKNLYGYPTQGHVLVKICPEYQSAQWRINPLWREIRNPHEERVIPKGYTYVEIDKKLRLYAVENEDDINMDVTYCDRVSRRGNTLIYVDRRATDAVPLIYEDTGEEVIGGPDPN